MVKTIWMRVLISIAAKWQCISLFAFAVQVNESIFLNIITNGLYTSEHYIAVAADLGWYIKECLWRKHPLYLELTQNN
jgi:hypothetical protein